jgi:hypothetical protein
MPKSKATTIPEPGSPTPERGLRSEFVVTPAVATEFGPAQAGARVHRAISSLERLARAGTISPAQMLAGERFRDDYELGILGAREPASGSSSSTGWSYTEASIDAVRRWRAAFNKLGPLAGYVIPVAVGQPGQGDWSIAQLARYIGQNRQEVTGCLKVGLTVLVNHYEIDGRYSR